MSKSAVNLITISAVLISSLSGCATSSKIDVVQPGDQNLSCAELRDEFDKLKKAESDISDNKEMNTTNVAAALFWLPGLAYTFYDAGEAEKLIRDRRYELTKIFNDKGCSRSSARSATSTQVSTAGAASRNITARAQSLLNDMGYDTGTPDGVAGPQTMRAILQFQSSKGLEESGVLDPDTLEALGL